MEEMDEVKDIKVEEELTSTQEKLKKIREKLENNPPKTKLGQRRLFVRAAKLDSTHKIETYQRLSEQMAAIEETKAYDSFKDRTKNLVNFLQELDHELEKIVAEMDEIENPKIRENKYDKISNKVESEKPKNYIEDEKYDEQDEKSEPTESERYKDLEAQYIFRTQDQKEAQEQLEDIYYEYKDKLSEIESEKIVREDIIREEKGIHNEKIKGETKALKEINNGPMQAISKFATKVLDSMKKTIKTVKDKLVQRNEKKQAERDSVNDMINQKLDNAENREVTFRDSLKEMTDTEKDDFLEAWNVGFETLNQKHKEVAEKDDEGR